MLPLTIKTKKYMKTVNVGGERLGSGGKLVTHLEGYGRSTHNLSSNKRTTLTTGTLIPIYTEFVQKGDMWKIDLDTILRTHPTNGPIFGSYKLQFDVFTADLRLYNKILHNNATRIGNKMADVLLPIMRVAGANPCLQYGDLNQQQIAPDSLLAYLGVRGIGTRKQLWDGTDANRTYVARNFEAVPLLMYWDIYKEYYANKQEEIGFVIKPSFETGKAKVTYITTEINNILTRYENETEEEQETIVIPQGGNLTLYGEFLSNRKIMYYNQAYGYLESLGWEKVIYSEDGKKTEYIGAPVTLEGVIINSRQIGETGNYLYIVNTNDVTTGNGESTVSTGIELKDFPLENIDDLREKIFAQPKTSPLTLAWINTNDRIAEYPYLGCLGIENLGEGGLITNESINYAKFAMSGLGIKTYQSDIQNNWLNKEWVENINEATQVVTADGKFSIEQFIFAEKLYKIENIVAISGGTYQDWLEGVWGEKTKGAAEMPVYRGGMSSRIVFDEVVSSSDATTAGGADQPLGTLGGRGAERMKNGGKIMFHAEEHGFIMIMASITPIIDYHQGNKWFMNDIMTMDDIHKPGLDKIGFQELITDTIAAWDTKIVEVPGGQDYEFHSMGKQPSWVHYQTNVNEVYGNFARENSEQFMCLTRRYNPTDSEAEIGEGLIEDATTYIDPTKYNYPFAYTELENQPFWLQVGVEAEVRRIMAANQMPNI